MIPYKLDYTIEKVLENRFLPEQKFTEKIQAHKWFVSERLGRDVGIFVAALDYFLNIQKLPPTPKTAS